ncbi:hypothetical protein [Chitinilyticum litopenaei]|uniref:hypothetical protein n=1 Tax=Chitinilyticum litopenaei TaxID=1121276 RepID=UPI00048D6668|nr:hypothetical protein [Chitinilyticum litopenaei]
MSVSCRSGWPSLAAALFLVAAHAWAEAPYDPDHDPLYLQVEQEIQSGHWEAARWLLEEFLQRQPDHFGARIELISVYCRLGLVEQSQLLHEQLLADPALNAMQRRALNLIADAGCVRVNRDEITLSSWMGYTSNLNRSTWRQVLEITTPDGEVTLPLDDLSKPRPAGLLGAQIQYRTGSEAEWLLQAGYHGSFSPAGYRQSWLTLGWQPRADLRVELSGNWFIEEAYRQALQLRYEPVLSQDAGQLLRAELQFKQEHYTVSPDYHASDLALGLRHYWLAEQSLLDVAVHAGYLHAPDRPGGSRSRLHAEAGYATGWRDYRIDGRLHYLWQQDAQGYSPLLNNNQRRQGQEWRISAGIEWGWRESIWRLEYSYQQLTDRIPLFSYREHALFLSSEWHWR